jgi:hypothetical protein
MSYYIHHVPGRLRIKSPVLKRHDGSENGIAELLRGLAGIDKIAVNGITGSCLIRYNPSMTRGDDIVLTLSKNGYFDPGRAVSNEECVQDAAEKAISILLPFLLTAAGEVLKPH